jgi:hypothetical protein
MFDNQPELMSELLRSDRIIVKEPARNHLQDINHKIRELETLRGELRKLRRRKASRPDSCPLESAAQKARYGSLYRKRVGLVQTAGSVTPAKGFGSSGRTRIRTSLRFLIRLLIGSAMTAITSGCVFQ